MAVKRYNITTPKKYEKNGEEQTQWLQVGSLTHFPATEEKEEGFRLELNMFPHLKLYVFPFKKRDDDEESKAETTTDDIPLD